MKTLISCAYTMDNCCVELKFSDGRMIAIDTIVLRTRLQTICISGQSWII